MSLDASMSRFRLASRDLFNNYFHDSHSETDDEHSWTDHERPKEERFSEVEDVLFEQLVTEPYSLENVRYGYLNSRIKVLLRYGDSAPILINREIDSGYWDHPIQEITNEAHMLFIEFFDWDQRAYRDNQYVRVQVATWNSHPEIKGKQALIEARYVRFDLV